MKQLLEYLINATTGEKIEIDVSKYALDIRHLDHTITCDMRSYTEYVYYMRKMLSKSSNIEKILKNSKQQLTLINRWHAAVVIEWDDAIVEFGKAIENRNILPLEALHAYILSKYKRVKMKFYKHYLDLYEIKAS